MKKVAHWLWNLPTMMLQAMVAAATATLGVLVILLQAVMAVVVITLGVFVMVSTGLVMALGTKFGIAVSMLAVAAAIFFHS